jgi:hypothetical protein
VNLVGFVIRIYHDARSSECQKDWWVFYAPIQNYCVISEREKTAVVGLSQILFIVCKIKIKVVPVLE